MTPQAPIALFVYNRPNHTQRTVEALRANILATQSDLIVYADAARDDSDSLSVAQVRRYVASITGFRSVTVVARDKNLGVDASVIEGVTTLCEQFGAAIVLEDDIVTSKWFLSFMNEGLVRYRDEPRVMQIGGFMFPIKSSSADCASFLPSVTSWGWATWDRAWRLFDPDIAIYKCLKESRVHRFYYDFHGSYYSFGLLKDVAEGNSNAWDVRWYATLYSNGGLTLFPHRSLVDNIGLDGSGVHSKAEDHLAISVASEPIRSFPPVACDTAFLQKYEAALREWLGTENSFGRLKRVLKRWLYRWNPSERMRMLSTKASVK